MWVQKKYTCLHPSHLETPVSFMSDEASQGWVWLSTLRRACNGMGRSPRSFGNRGAHKGLNVANLLVARTGWSNDHVSAGIRVPRGPAVMGTEPITSLWPTDSNNNNNSMFCNVSLSVRSYALCIGRASVEAPSGEGPYRSPSYGWGWEPLRIRSVTYLRRWEHCTTVLYCAVEVCRLYHPVSVSLNIQVSCLQPVAADGRRRRRRWRRRRRRKRKTRSYFQEKLSSIDPLYIRI